MKLSLVDDESTEQILGKADRVSKKSKAKRNSKHKETDACRPPKHKPYKKDKYKQRMYSD